MEYNKCPHCGASLKQYWQPLTPILIIALSKLRSRVLDKQSNEIHLQKELNLTKNEYNNFQKLRFHGLIAKVKDVNGLHKSGYWLLTRRGAEFLNGKVCIPKRVKTFRNRIVEYDPECVYVDEVMTSDKFVDTIETIEFDLAMLEQQRII